jgi:hypothetical protein
MEGSPRIDTLWISWKDWAGQRNEGAFASQKALSKALKARKFDRKKDPVTRRMRFHGIQKRGGEM